MRNGGYRWGLLVGFGLCVLLFVIRFLEIETGHTPTVVLDVACNGAAATLLAGCAYIVHLR